jgi:predicted ATP-grasp superfamily ATP-dependent carboligase
MSAADLPPVIVLGVDTPIGLTVVRELGERGVPVHGIARRRQGIGLYSRWLTQGYLRPTGEAATLELLRGIGQRHAARFVIAISEADTLFVRRAADAGKLPGLAALAPALDKLQVVNDKLATYAIAAAIGIPLPVTWQPRAADETPPADLTYPCILKWRSPDSVTPSLARHGLDLLKAEYCYGSGELGRALGRYSPVGQYPMVQSFCPGVGLGHMFFMHGGKALLRFQHRRVAEWPPEGGTSTVCDSLPLSDNAGLLAQSEELLRRIGWEGAAMVEYRYDRASGARLMEINGRFWGSLPLAYHAGAPFAWLTYAVLGLGQRPAVPPYRSGVRCRFMVPETRRVLTLLFNRKAIQHRGLALSGPRALLAYAADFLRPGARYYVFAWRDPRPFLADMFFVARAMAAAALARVMPKFAASSGRGGKGAKST